MAFPSPSLAPPALNLYQWSYGGLAFGGVGQTTYQVQSATIDMPDVASADLQRALEQGEFAGMDVLPGKDITIVQLVTTPGLTGSGVTLAQAQAVDVACQQLGGVMGPGGVTEQPLYFQMASGLFACMARPRKHNCPWDINRAFAGGAVATTLLHATDPRWYAAPSKQSVPISLPAPLGGYTFPGSFPALFGGGGVGGLVTVYNNGLFETRPVLVITGPCTNPVITNLSIVGSPQIGVTISLAAGDTLTIDTDMQSVLYVTSGTTAAVSRDNAVTPNTTWWNLPPGASIIEFTTGDATQVAAALVVQSADAWLTL